MLFERHCFLFFFNKLCCQRFLFCDKTTTWCSVSVITLILQSFAYFWICWGSKHWSLQNNHNNLIVFANWINWLNERLSSEKLVCILKLFLNQDLMEDCAFVKHSNSYIILNGCSVISLWKGVDLRSTVSFSYVRLLM